MFASTGTRHISKRVKIVVSTLLALLIGIVAVPAYADTQQARLSSFRFADQLILVRGSHFPASTDITVTAKGTGVHGTLTGKTDAKGRFFGGFTFQVQYAGSLTLTAQAGTATATANVGVGRNRHGKGHRSTSSTTATTAIPATTDTTVADDTTDTTVADDATPDGGTTGTTAPDDNAGSDASAGSDDSAQA